jgi:chitodextrinase
MRRKSPWMDYRKIVRSNATTVFGSGLVWLALFLQMGSVAFAAITPRFVQEKDNQVTSGNVSSATFSAPTTAGNLIAVYLIWDSTGTASVSDSLRNTYVSAVAPAQWGSGKYSSQIFYTISLGSGVDIVSATFGTKIKSFGIVYAHEYAGISQTAPVDVTAAAIGTSGSLASGSASTTIAVDLLFAGGVSTNVVTSPGTGYTARSNSQGNMTEDRIVSAKGSYSATAGNSGGAWGMQMVAFKGAGADTTPPTVPTGLSANGLSSTQISVSWTASTDTGNTSSQLVYNVYRNGSSIGRTAAGVTSWTDVALAASTTYSYTVSATDPAGNTSAQSPAVQGTTLPLVDTTPPTVPGNLAVTGTTASTASLAWTASTDNVGVTGYKISRGGVQVGTSTTASYTDTGLAPSTTYSYAVSAYDAAGNNSAQTAAVTATTKTQDTQGPTVSITSPANNQNVSGTTTITASATDTAGVAGVQFQLDGTSLGAEVTAAPYKLSWDTTQATSASHVLTAIARDTLGNRTTSSGVTATVSNGSTHPYTTNFPLTENPISEGGNWINGKTDGVDWGDVRTTPGLAFGTNAGGFADSTAILDGSWGPDQMAQATVHSVNQTDNIYEEVELRLRSTILAHSNTGYEINFRCSKTGNTYSQIVRWNGPLGNFTYLWASSGSQYGVANGDVVKATMIGNVITTYLNGVQLAQVTDNTYATGNPGMGFYLSGATGVNADYGFTNFTASDSLSTDTTPPSIPANLSANAVSSSEIDLTWSPSTDNVAVAGYQVFRDTAQIATTTSAKYFDKAVAAGVQYTYAVAAFDAAGNISLQSSPVSGQTSSGSDTTPPSVPANLQSSKVTSSSLTVAWSPSTDNVGVAGYQVFRNGVQVGTVTTTTFADTGLAVATTYAYTVAAYDSSGNVSVQSPSLLVTTTSSAVTPPSIVQTNQNQISSGTSTAVTFNAPTLAGNTIVAYVIWSNTGSVALSDSRGDAFVSVGPAIAWSTGYSAQVLYASNIVGGSDTVTATFRTAVSSFGVVYVHEYAGISVINPIDVTAAATGSSSSLNSGSATTTSANDLIFGAGVSDNVITAAGSGFTSRDTAFGNITEDRTAATIGPYSATATQNGKLWGMQMVAFRAAQ